MALAQRKNLIFKLMDLDFNQLVLLEPLLPTISLEYYYVQMMRYYYSGDVDGLTKLLSRLTLRGSSSEELPLRHIISYRKKMLLGTLSETDGIQLEHLGLKTPLYGDILFCLGLGAYKLKNFVEAKRQFLKAHQELYSQGVFKKSGMALLNTIVMEGNIYPKKRLLSDYLSILEKSNLNLSKNTQSLLCSNISEEFIKLGAFATAFHYREKSLELIEGQKGTNQYQDFLALKCDLLFLLGQFTEAHRLLDQLSNTKNSELLEALKAIRVRHLKAARNQLNLKKGSPPWKAKFRKSFNPIPLGPKEEEFINLISYGPISTDEIIESLYKNIEYHDGKNNFTTLLSRLQKKSPGLLKYNKTLQMIELTNNRLLNEIQKLQASYTTGKPDRNIYSQWSLLSINYLGLPKLKADSNRIKEPGIKMDQGKVSIDFVNPAEIEQILKDQYRQSESLCPLALAQYYLCDNSLTESANRSESRMRPLEVIYSLLVGQQTKETQAILCLYLAHEYDKIGNKSKYLDIIKKGQSLLECEKSMGSIYKIYKTLQLDQNDNETLVGKERILFEALEKGPHSKYDLISAVYGSNQTLLKTEGRFKVLLSRLRKKVQGQIVRDFNGLYKLVPPSSPEA